jgi:hypothetical protein
MDDGEWVEEWACELCGAVWLYERGEFSEPRARRRVIEASLVYTAECEAKSIYPLWTWAD